MPIYDLHCITCSATLPDKILKIDELLPNCVVCGSLMARTCNCTTFKLKYNNKTDLCDWEGNTSQYWSEYNKQKSEGGNVRIPEMDGE